MTAAAFFIGNNPTCQSHLFIGRSLETFSSDSQLQSGFYGQMGQGPRFGTTATLALRPNNSPNHHWSADGKHNMACFTVVGHLSGHLNRPRPVEFEQWRLNTGSNTDATVSLKLHIKDQSNTAMTRTTHLLYSRPSFIQRFDKQFTRITFPYQYL
ncbi:hypothetical protein CEXT_813821 [Caerostris extrusa]|uniref:Uncharacterized protein n=1 Tax=Caerostris extrusa TaxID=172846 RepID=A0AAV4VWX9_CAEEX|nr:hypothetical protein CEXT_813821 [Caerostris extrusa]